MKKNDNIKRLRANKELMMRNCSEAMSYTSTDSDGEGSVDFDAVFNVYSQ